MLQKMVSFNLTYKYYLPRIVASHPSSLNCAWFVKDHDAKARVHILNAKTSANYFIKDFDSDFLTLQFSENPIPLLAVLSNDGCLRLYHITNSEPMYTILFVMKLKESTSALDNICLKWAPLSSNAEKHKDTSLLLAASVNETAYVFDFNWVLSNLSALQSPLHFDMSDTRYQSRSRLMGNIATKFPCLKSSIRAMDFSSDATILIAGFSDGMLSVFKLLPQVVEGPKLCQTFNPDESRELSASYIVCDERTSAPEGYLIIGSKYNSHLLLWRAHDFSLIQSIRFCPSKEESSDSSLRKSTSPRLITHFDRRTNLLIASDVVRRVLYVLHLAAQSEQGDLQFRCVNVFPLVNPCIAFDVSRITRSLPVNHYVRDRRSPIVDKIVIDLSIAYPTDLYTGQLSYLVPTSIYHSENSHSSPDGHRYSPISKLSSETATSLTLDDEARAPGMPFSVYNNSMPVNLTNASKRGFQSDGNFNNQSSPIPGSRPVPSNDRVGLPNSAYSPRGSYSRLIATHPHVHVLGPGGVDSISSKAQTPAHTIQKPTNLARVDGTPSDVEQIKGLLLDIQRDCNSQTKSVDSLTGRMCKMEAEFERFTDTLNGLNTTVRKLRSDDEQLKSFQDQIREILRLELANVLEGYIPKITESLQTNLARSIKESLKNVPKLVAEGSTKHLEDPAFIHSLSQSIISVLKPTFENTYRDELKCVYGPRFNESIDKIFKDFHSVIAKGLENHLQTVFARIDQGCASSREEMDAVAKKCEEIVNKLKVDLVLRKTESETRQAPNAPPLTTVRIASPAAYPTTSPNYASPLESALKSENLEATLQVLRQFPVDRLINQSVGQELLLSLIHKLTSFDIHDQFDLKLTFLEKTLAHLDVKDDTVRKYGWNVLGILINKIGPLCSNPRLDEDRRERAFELMKSAVGVQSHLPTKTP